MHHVVPPYMTTPALLVLRIFIAVVGSMYADKYRCALFTNSWFSAVTRHGSLYYTGFQATFVICASAVNNAYYRFLLSVYAAPLG